MSVVCRLQQLQSRNNFLGYKCIPHRAYGMWSAAVRLKLRRIPGGVQLTNKQINYIRKHSNKNRIQKEFRIKSLKGDRNPNKNRNYGNSK